MMLLNRYHSKCKKLRGFTLVELLVVIAIIALLMSILMPALNMARDHGQRVVCSGNIRNLSSAWMMYYQNNGGNVVSSSYGTPTNPSQIGWVDVMRSSIPNDTHEEAIKRGKLFKYLKNPKVYICPSTRPDDEGEGRRTYTLSPKFWNMHINKSVLTSTGGSTFNVPKLRRNRDFVTNFNQLKRPSDTFNVIDDSGRNGDGFFALPKYDDTWWNIINTRHTKGSLFGYADGHVAYRKWKENVTIEAMEYSDRNSTSFVVDNSIYKSSTKVDLIFTQKHTWGDVGWQ